MATVTVHQPDAQASAPVSADTVSDSTGRVIGMRKPPILQQYNIILAVGPEAARNETYMSLVTPLLWVSTIDGDPVATPKSKAMIDALIQRLDEAGIEAVMGWITARVQLEAAQAEAARDAAKN